MAQAPKNNDFARIAAGVNPSSFLDYKVYLESLYLAMKAKTSRYSYAKFAQDLGFNASNILHQIVRGHRPLTVKAAQKIIDALDLRGVEKKYLLLLIQYNNATAVTERESLFNKLVDVKNEVLPTTEDKSWLEFFSEWYHPVVRELVGLPEFKSDPEWISDQIMPRIRPEQAKKSLELLANLGLIVWDKEKRRYQQTEKRIVTGQRVRGIGFTRYHQHMIDMGKESLTRVSGSARDISAVTVSVDLITYQKMKAMAHEFQMKMLDVAETAAEPDRIYQLNIQLFPFTK